MKLVIDKTLVFLAALLVLVVQLPALAQDKPKAELYDDVGFVCSEDLMARYDAFLNQLAVRAGNRGMIVLTGDRTAEGRNVNMFRWLTHFYPQIRQFNKDGRIEFVRGANEDQLRIRFWVIPSGAAMPTITPFEPQMRITETVRYDVAGGDFHRYQGKSLFYFDGYYQLGCDFAPYQFGFLENLRRDNSLIGYAVVYSTFGTGSRYGKRVERFVVNELLKSRGVDRNRIKTIYGGNRNKPEVEFWLVPRGGKLPPLRPDEERYQK